MALNSIATEQAAPETAAFLKWIESEKGLGLIDVKFFKKDTSESTIETFCAEVNQMLRAPTVADPDLF